MGKHAREQRRHAERARRSAGPAADVADRAERGLATLIDGITDVAALKGRKVRRINVAGFAEVRQHFLDRGHRWPSWCYLPVPFLGVTLGEEIAIDVNPSLVSPATILAALIAAWVPGRIAVRFDPDLAAALMETPLEATIPLEALHRLPAWCLYVDTPELAPGTGVFVAVDPGGLKVPGQPVCDDTDELLIAIVRPSKPRLIMSTVWLLPGASIADSLARQEAQTRELGVGMLEVGDDEWGLVFGMSRQEVLARLLSLVLYLCSDDTDTTQIGVLGEVSHGRPSAPKGVTVVSAGFRVGAALRGGCPPDGTQACEVMTGRRVTPHLRAAHWHHYWCGSEARGDRRLELRWIPPVPVNADLAEDGLLTVVRPASIENRSHRSAKRARAS